MDTGIKNRRDIIVTWPKARPLGSYMVQLEQAKARELLVNFRVPRLPCPKPERCYRVWDARVRGFLAVVACTHRGFGEVTRVPDDPLYEEPGARHWPPGNYVVCEPFWYEVPQQIEMSGFRGWRWFDRKAVGDGG